MRTHPHRIHPYAYISQHQDVEDLLLRIDRHPEHNDRGTPQSSEMIEIVNFIQDDRYEDQQKLSIMDDALRKIEAMDYTCSATNMYGYKADKIVRKALEIS